MGVLCNRHPSASGNISSTNIGTYGQFGLGLAGQVANTGWLGYVRADYRTGDNIKATASTGGVRYQFTPDVIAARCTRRRRAESADDAGSL